LKQSSSFTWEVSSGYHLKKCRGNQRLTTLGSNNKDKSSNKELKEKILMAYLCISIDKKIALTTLTMG